MLICSYISFACLREYPGDYWGYDWNLQGSSASTESKWNIVWANFGGTAGVDILMVEGSWFSLPQRFLPGGIFSLLGRHSHWK